MPIPRNCLALAFLLLFTASASIAEAGKAGNELVQASLLADADAAVPGGHFTVGVKLKIKEGWHTYWINPGESGNATEIKMHGPAGFEFGPIAWPLPSQFNIDGGIIYGYTDEVLLLIPVAVSKSVAPTGDARIDADVKWLSCKDTCIEGAAQLSIALPISLNAKPANTELFSTWKQRLPISSEQSPAAEMLGKIEQGSTASGAPAPAFTVQWKTTPRKVEWFPVSTNAAVVENIVLKQDGNQTHIQYKVTVYKPQQLSAGRMDSLLVFEDANGKQVGIPVSIKVTQ